MGKILKQGERFSFFCPGCDQEHEIVVSPGHWNWNESEEAPTFTPSVLVTAGHYASSYKPGGRCWCTYKAEHPDENIHAKCFRCHSFVRDGNIQYLADCSHALAGQTVPLLVYPWLGRE